MKHKPEKIPSWHWFHTWEMNLLLFSLKNPGVCLDSEELDSNQTRLIRSAFLCVRRKLSMCHFYMVSGCWTRVFNTQRMLYPLAIPAAGVVLLSLTSEPVTQAATYMHTFFMFLLNTVVLYGRTIVSLFTRKDVWLVPSFQWSWGNLPQTYALMFLNVLGYGNQRPYSGTGFHFRCPLGIRLSSNRWAVMVTVLPTLHCRASCQVLGIHRLVDIWSAPGLVWETLSKTGRKEDKAHPPCSEDLQVKLS